MSGGGESATIRAVVRALDGQEALVEVAQGGCGRCHEEGGCGGQHLTQMFCSSPKTYRVVNSLDARVGEAVTIAVAAGSIRRTANLVYGIPLLATILGAVLGVRLSGDVGAMSGAVLGMLVALAYVRHRSRSRAQSPAERPHIISRS